MKLIREYSDTSTAEEVSDRLRNKGVMTVVLGQKIRALPLWQGGSKHVGLWVVFEDQVEDGIELLGNRKHTPKRKISISEMEEIESAGKHGLRSIGKKWLERLALALGVGIIIYVLVKVLWGLKSVV